MSQTWRRPWQISLYRLGMRLATPAAGFVLRHRLKRGKEDPARLPERMGRPSRPRPQGRLVWLHGASVGETVTLTPIVSRLIDKGLTVLVTSGTVTSARVMAERLPVGAIHQFIPLDSPRFMRKFLKHWRPELGLVAESELWPNMLIEARKLDIPMMLLNGRMSDRSHARWSRQPAAARLLLQHFDVVLAQALPDAERFQRLGAPRVVLAGNLKYDVAPPPADPAMLALLDGALAGRPVWIAASTHPGEDEIVIDAHTRIAARLPGLVTIIAPRHPQRGPDIEALARGMGVSAGCRSAGLAPDRAIDLSVADTVGELGLFYRLCPIAFLGGSLVEHGGQNPIEPAKLQAAIVHGPHTHNFTDVYSLLDESGGAVKVTDAGALAGQVHAWLKDGAAARAVGRMAQAQVMGLGGVADRTMAAIEPLLARGALAGREAAP
jgi:3-deoxy-D-manno-octulosonic-acid transferase